MSRTYSCFVREAYACGTMLYADDIGLKEQLMNWKNWLAERKAETLIEKNLVNLDQIKDWRLSAQTLDRPDGLYFAVKGFWIRLRKPGVDFSWGQPLLQPEEPIHGWVILAVAQEADNDYLLFNAKPEPGWPEPFLAPSFQASKSKLLKNPGYPLRKLADAAEAQLVWQDGGVHYNKRNYVGICLFPSREAFTRELGELKSDMHWFTPREYAEALAAEEVSDHLLQTVGCLYGYYNR